ncbi:MAG: cupin domain-containing protein [Oligoflexia bacterium]|nr:cupin domain-containing protein [Oligoflexia bacterium]
MWEMHPEGDEIVICVEGQIELIQLIEDKEISIVLKRGDFAINKKNVWHTANVSGKASAVFITTGFGTKNKERK